MEILVRAGCDTTAICSNSGKTGREAAIENGHTAVIEPLDALEAEVEAKAQAKAAQKRAKNKKKREAAA